MNKHFRDSDFDELIYTWFEDCSCGCNGFKRTGTMEEFIDYMHLCDKVGYGIIVSHPITHFCSFQIRTN
jgi:hypothetical protein